MHTAGDTPQFGKGKIKAMKDNKTLFELICEVNDQLGYRGLNKQKVVDYAVENYGKFLNSRSVYKVCEIMHENFNDFLNLEENLKCAIEDYLQK